MPIDQIEQASFLRQYLQHEAGLRVYLRALLGDWHEVDDVSQETCLVAMNRYDTFQDGTNFRAWIFTIGRFESLKYRRNRATRRMRLAEDVAAMLEEEIASQQPDADSDFRDALESCVSGLPEHSRSLLEAVYFEQLPIKTVASQANRTLDAVYKHLQRLREGLLQCIERRVGPEAQS